MSKVVRRDNKIHPHRDEVVRLYQSHWSDARIAMHIGVSRRQLTEYRRTHLQLPAVPRSELEGREIGRRNQELTLGRSPADIRAEQWWGYATSLGWPAGIRKRAVQILELLYVHEALTRKQIPALLKLKESVALTSNDPQGTYLANLISRGLVAAAGRAIDMGSVCKDGRTRTGKKVNLYFLTPAARAMKKSWLDQNGKEQRS